MKPCLTGDPLCSLGAQKPLSGLSTNSGGGTRADLQLFDYKQPSGILIHSFSPVGH